MNQPKNNLGEQLARFYAERGGSATISTPGLVTANEKRYKASES